MPKETSNQPVEDNYYALADDRIRIDATEPLRPLIICDDTEIEDLEPLPAQLFTLYAKERDTAVTYAVASQALWGRSNPKAQSYIRLINRKIRSALPEDLADTKQGALWTINQVGNVAVSSLDENNVGFYNASNYVDSIADGRILIDFDLWMVKADDVLLRSLSLMEFKIIAVLASNRGSIMSPEQLAAAVWGGYHSSRSHIDVVKVQIANVRRKLGRDLGHTAIKTQRGEGYYVEAT